MTHLELSSKLQQALSVTLHDSLFHHGLCYPCHLFASLLFRIIFSLCNASSSTNHVKRYLPSPFLYTLLKLVNWNQALNQAQNCLRGFIRNKDEFKTCALRISYHSVFSVNYMQTLPMLL